MGENDLGWLNWKYTKCTSPKFFGPHPTHAKIGFDLNKFPDLPKGPAKI